MNIQTSLFAAFLFICISYAFACFVNPAMTPAMNVWHGAASFLTGMAGVIICIVVALDYY